MITKVSYRPYASGVNNTQTQPQRVNFGAKPQITEKAMTDGVQVLVSLVSVFSIGKFRIQEGLSQCMLGIADILEQTGAAKLAMQLKDEVGTSTDAQILGLMRKSVEKPKPQTVFDFFAHSYVAGENRDQSVMPKLLIGFEKTLRKNDAQELADGFNLWTKVIGLDQLIQISDAKLSESKNPWFAGVMREFARIVKG